MHRYLTIFFSSIFLLGFYGCKNDTVPFEYEARVGDRYLTNQDIRDALLELTFDADSSEAKRQIIEQWTTNELLYQEALRNRLNLDPQVQQALEENERSVLISAFVSELYQQEDIEPTQDEVQAYYERNKQYLGLREPFVLVRYLSTRDQTIATEALRQLRQTPRLEQDSIWQVIVSRAALDPEGSIELANNYYPESRLFAAYPEVNRVLQQLNERQPYSPVIVSDSLFHIIQVVERITAGTIPESQWIEAELIRRLVIERRKQMYARQVQRLRNESLAREEFEIK